MLLVGYLGLVVEIFGAQSLELLTGVLLPFCGGVVVAQSTFTLSVSPMIAGNHFFGQIDIRLEAADLVSLLIRCESLHFCCRFVG